MTRAADVEAAAADWVAREDGEGWTEAQSRALAAWLDADTAHRVAYLRLRAAWDRADRLGALRAPAAVSSPRRTGVSARWGLAAAAAGLVVGVAALGLLARPAAEVLSTPLGGRETATLADGSRLVLNTDTRVRTEITTGRRLVILDKGEAFFDVRHDAAHPFVVIAGDRRITDLGTRFSVRLDGDAVKVVVEQGRVRIERLGASSSRGGARAPAASALDPPEVVSRGGVAMATEKAILVLHKDDTELAKDLTWRDGVLSFNQTTLADAAAEFNRYNRKKLVVDGRAAQIRINGAFRDDNIDSFARLLHDGFGLKIEEQGEEIHISG